MRNATAIEELLLSGLREAGLRITLARRAICRVLGEAHEEFLTAPEIGRQVASSTGGVDSSTVYRTLEELADLGLIHHVHLHNQTGTWHVTLDRDHHQHLVCEECSKTITVPLPTMERAYEVMREEYGFEPNLRHMAIVGLCAECIASKPDR